MDDIQETINVHIGEIKIVKNGELLKAIFGSCVGICFIWKQKKICGLAHCLLPMNPEKEFVISGRYVDQAINSLFILMKITEENIDEIGVVITGGGNMTNPNAADNSKLIGGQNLAMAEKELKKRRMKIIHVEHGGIQGRKITVDSKKCTYQIEVIPRITSEER
jgi:chemotaxis protein CheD